MKRKKMSYRTFNETSSISIITLLLLFSSCYVPNTSYIDPETGIRKDLMTTDIMFGLADGIATAVDNPTSESNTMKLQRNNIQSGISNVVIEYDENNDEAIKFMQKYSKTFTGWWVYGEGQHIFKDEATLEEYDLVFLNENMEELVEIYMAVCEMEYFPMECEMNGYSNGSKLMVQEFDILYIQGCGE